MGVYVYTLRAASRNIDGVQIGHYAYAYKTGWDWHADSSVPSIRRRVRALYSRAEDAAYKNRDVRHFINTPFQEIGNDPVPVFITDKVIDSFQDTSLPGIVVGHVKREGRRLRFIPKEM